jgi:ABC-type transport system involved in multi-copper enzyme maturation permease subunit
MTYKNMTTFASIIAFIFALGFILMPAQLTSFYNVTLNEGGILIAQLFGAALLGYGVLNWFGRSFGDGQAKQTLVNTNLASDVVGLIFALIGQLGGVPGVNALGWSTVLIYLLLAAGFAYLRFTR